MKLKGEEIEKLHAQWRLEVKARGKDPEIDKQRFETLEGIQEFKFIQIGAAVRIQKVFRSWRKINKRKWRKKFAKLVAKLIVQKKLFRAIQKSKTTPFVQNDLDDPSKLKPAAATVINRVVRGFLGRNRWHRIHQEKLDEMKRQEKAALKLQTFARRVIVWQRFPGVGFRYRLFIKKKVLFYKQKELNINNEVIRKFQLEIKKDQLMEEKPEASKFSALGKSFSMKFTGSHDQNDDDDQYVKEQKKEDNGDELNFVIPPGLLSTKSSFKLLLGNSRDNEEENDNDNEDNGKKEDKQQPKYYIFEYPEDCNPSKRRETLLFPHLRLSDDFEFLHEKAMKIQCFYRILGAKKRIAIFREQKRIHCIQRIQRWFRRLTYFNKVYSILLFLFDLKQKCYQIAKQKHQAIVKIQANIRRFIQQKHFYYYVNQRKISTEKLSIWFYQRYCVKKIHKTIEFNRNYKELQAAGILLYQQTEMKWMAYYLYEGIKKMKNIEKQSHELQKIFTSHSLATGMDVAKTIKLIKDCKGLFKEGEFSLNNVELQYMKIKHGNEKRIDYPTFLDLLSNLMILKEIRIDPPKGLWEMDENSTIYLMKNSNNNNNEATKPSLKENANPNNNNNNNEPGTITVKELKDYKFAGFKGKLAFLMKFIILYLSTTSDYQRIVDYLGSKSAFGQMQSLLTSTIRIIQQFWKNRLILSQLKQNLKNYQREKRIRKYHEAAKKIQNLIRHFLGLRFLTKIAQNCYHKFIDGETEREYWYNPKTGASFWSKPKLLGIYDCGMALRMPSEIEKYVVNCQICEKNYGTCYCKDCQYVYCTPCYSTSHRSGNRIKHSYLHINNCIQCDFQIGTKYCLSCKDLYCDSCYFYMHKKGRLRFHSFEKYCELCDFCHAYSAQVIETGYNYDNVSLLHYWCNRCYKQEYQMIPADRLKELKNTKKGTYSNVKRKWKQCRLEKYQYYGKAYTEYAKNLAEEQKKKEIQIAYAKRLEELQKLKEIAAAITIQRIFRGYKKRHEIIQFIAERKEFLLLRQEEDKQRNSLVTKFLNFFGFTQVFDSDTPLERVHKLYPWYMHEIVAQCIENKWNDACAMLMEHDEFMKNKPKSSIWKYYSLTWKLYFAQRDYQQVCQEYDAKYILVNNASENYYNAEMSGAFEQGKLKKMKQSVNKLQKELSSMEELKNTKYVTIAQIEREIMDITGPRRLQKLIENRRRHGIPLPFKISIRKHSRHALVEYTDDLSTANGDLFSIDEELGVELSPEQRAQLEQQRQLRLQQGGGAGGENGSISSHQPGEWRKKLKLHDSIYIKGIEYQIVPTMNQKKKSKSGKSNKKSSKNGGEDGGGEGDGSGQLDGSESKKKKKSGTLDSSKDNSNSQGARDLSTGEGGAAGGAGEDGKGNGAPENPYKMFEEPIEGEELKEEVTLNHITLDHPWMLEDCYGIEIYKLPKVVFYEKPIRSMKRMVIRFYFIQKIIAILAIFSHKWSKLFEMFIKYFDEDNSMYKKCQNVIISSIKTRDYFLSCSIYIIVLSFDFTLRRKIAKQFYKIYLLLKMIFMNVYNIYHNLTSGMKETPYEYWQRSLEKEVVQCIYEVSSTESINLGEFRMDIKAPLEIMREYICRRFRIPLNKTIGESFIFFRINPNNEKEEYCAREDEFRIHAKDFVIMKTDNITFESTLTVTIVKDKDRGKVLIPEFQDDFDDIGSLEKKNEEDDDLDNGSLA